MIYSPKTSSEKADSVQEQSVTVEVQFCPESMWFKSDITMTEHAEMMNTGMLDGKLINAVSLFNVENSTMVYDYNRLGDGRAFWRVE